MKYFMFLVTLILSCNIFAKSPSSLELKFILDEDYLISYAIYACSNDRLINRFHRDLNAFKRTVCDQLTPDDWDALDDLCVRFYNKSPLTDNLHLVELLSRIKQLSEYQTIRKQTQEYLELCKKRWEESFPACLSLMENLTGITFDATFTVYITHPGICNGSSMSPQMIFWGNKEWWPHYTVVYLWHEIFHDYFDLSGTSHAIIQLLTDNELRQHLSGEPYPPFEGHPGLIPQMKAYEPDWNEYLKKKEKNIFEFIELMKKKYPELEEHPEFH